MEIVETHDLHFNTVYRVYDGVRLKAVAYTKRDAEVIKVALEKDKGQREKEDSSHCGL